MPVPRFPLPTLLPPFCSVLKVSLPAFALPWLCSPQVAPVTVPLSTSGLSGSPALVLPSPLKPRLRLKSTHSEPLPTLPGSRPVRPRPKLGSAPAFPTSRRLAVGRECLPQFQPPALCPQTWTNATACPRPVTAGAARTRQAASCACALLGTRLRPTEPAARVRAWEGHKGGGHVGQDTAAVMAGNVWGRERQQ